MKTTELQLVVDALKAEGIEFDLGLTEKELAAIEATHNFKFPPELRAFLAFELPVSESFPDWRRATDNEINGWLNWPAEGIMFDIDRNDYWIEEWGEIPRTLDEARKSVQTRLSNAPILIPIYAHRYIPVLPQKAGNPVFSVMQTDIIQYGANFRNYLEHEFKIDLGTNLGWYSEPTNKIDFWDDIINNN